MFRFLRRILVVIGAVLVLAGCGTEEGMRAQALLQQAEAEQAKLSSSTFEGSMSFSFQGQQVAMQFRMAEAFTKLGPLAGADGVDLSKLGVKFGDIRALLTIDERTHLLGTALIKVGIEAQGEKVELDLRYRLTSANEPVELPSPTG